MRRRVVFWSVVLLGALAIAVIAAAPWVDRAVKETVTLPLRHDDIIRQQARDKDLDPALIAAVIYSESHFRDNQRSSAGAIGLMQLTPETAQDVAKRSGATNFQLADLDDPQVNISYGSYQLRYLLERYGGNEVLAVAAYNAGEGNVDKWLVDASVNDRLFKAREIPFPETRNYVEKVMDARAQYRREYKKELGV
jgi:peptidoglycan lytic transglycosylase